MSETCGKEIHLGRGTVLCTKEAGHASGECGTGPRSPVDCRDCRHRGEVTEGEGVECLQDPGDPFIVSWRTATSLTAECSTFEARPDCCAAGGCGTCVSCPTPDAKVIARDGHGRDDVEAGTKDTNPKDAIGSTKLPLHLVPELTVAYASLAHLNGALKYGKANYRSAGVRASIYIDAAKRHLDAFAAGEEFDPEDGVPNLSGVLACVGIILDARAAGKLTDDRCLPNPGYRSTMKELTTHVARLQELHKDAKPKHFTITDTEAP